MRLTRRGVVGGAVAAAAVGCRAEIERPNVLFVFPDQLRARALSDMAAAGYALPAFLRLAEEGAELTQALCSNPLCSPARSTLLTGLYPSLNTVTSVTTPLPLAVPCISEVLSAAGWSTGFLGKWHLDGESTFVPPGPRRRGFQEFVGFNRNGHTFIGSVFYRDDPTPLHPDPPDTYEPIYQTDHAIDFLERNRELPFYLMIGYQPPHNPEAGELEIGDWGGQIPQEWMDAVDPSTLPLLTNVPVSHREKALAFLHGYYAAILSIDHEIGRLLDALDRLGLAERTIVVVTSDHGELGGSHGAFGKEEPFDESVRVPLYVRWPGRIAPTRYDGPVNHADLVPTLLSMLGGPPLYTHGRDLSGLLVNGDPVPEGVGYVQCSVSTDEAWHMVRSDRYVWVERADGRVSLYDRDVDPAEQTDLSDEPSLQGVRDALATSLAAFRARTASWG